MRHQNPQNRPSPSRHELKRTPSTAELLGAWEQGLNQPPVWQAVALLSAACPGVPLARLAQLRIGRRDAELLALRERLFGLDLVGVTSCPTCSEKLDLSFTTADIYTAEMRTMAEQAYQPEVRMLVIEGYEISFQLPNSYDLALLPEQNEDLHVAREQLLRRCIVSVCHDGSMALSAQLPPAVAEKVIEQMGLDDSQGNVELGLICPFCGLGWTVPFDIACFFWAEVHHWALRLLHEVHLLAQAYGWREQDILALSPWRRQCYLNMVQG